MVDARYILCDTLKVSDWTKHVASELGKKDRLTEAEITTLYGDSVDVAVKVDISVSPKVGDNVWVGSEGRDMVYVTSPDMSTVRMELEKYNSQLQDLQSESGLGSHQLLILLDGENVNEREEPIAYGGTTQSMGMTRVKDHWEVKEMGTTFQSINLVVESPPDNVSTMTTLPEGSASGEVGPTEEESRQAWGFLSQTATL
ncbi:hypothetical protein TREMEDRAFT_58911 [Tremella mesenterica DSM 1558]|uniref:uncharacterized protein n=1 Tax=Tremella mesenterica (strain ATCC 24925 / CBS 8224 / DSM 1558 / NBRC 9311 / NRRL Y-6157 / RJB 2259-6 / UBC 559-6) TaxID=578456 RepID=UPI0003F48BFD|nr:uncharacterized protein TREMEDRAFT_58911 [Tremella mesenterica DSM 1558]EIW72744.1 hypothetical protein TREMEDRAFT_58911 [Tremella mesenterica DSM 1558]